MEPAGEEPGAPACRALDQLVAAVRREGPELNGALTTILTTVTKAVVAVFGDPPQARP